MPDFQPRTIVVATIEHDKQRYPTAGDWFWLAREARNAQEWGEQDDQPTLVVRISDTGSWRYNALLAVHELIEALLCANDGVTQEQVDDFDQRFEKLRATMTPLMAELLGEPGDHRDAPYRKQHCYATAVERMLCAAMGIDWVEYDAAVEALNA